LYTAVVVPAVPLSYVNDLTRAVPIAVAPDGADPAEEVNLL